MIQFATSYFYQIRFFKPNMIPISTARWDPSWFHKGKGEKFTFFDDNGVINGLRLPEFAPGPMCEGLCSGNDKCIGHNPSSCDFLKIYRKQLNSIPYKDLIHRCEKYLTWYKSKYEREIVDPIFVMIVYEAPDNSCSERAAIQDWFKSHGVDCKELVVDKK